LFILGTGSIDKTVGWPAWWWQLDQQQSHAKPQRTAVAATSPKFRSNSAERDRKYIKHYLSTRLEPYTTNFLELVSAQLGQRRLISIELEDEINFGIYRIGSQEKVELHCLTYTLEKKLEMRENTCLFLVSNFVPHYISVTKWPRNMVSLS
jgi:hypothetical protein